MTDPAPPTDLPSALAMFAVLQARAQACGVALRLWQHHHSQ